MTKRINPIIFFIGKKNKMLPKKFYRFLSDIGKPTKIIFCHPRNAHYIPKEWQPLIHFVSVPGFTFLQDPFIILQEISDKGYKDVLIILQTGLQRALPFSYPILFQAQQPCSDLELGGNFLVTPPTPRYQYGVVLYVPPLRPFFMEKINSLALLTPLVEWNCSFRFRGMRHVDELVCFMPDYKDHKLPFKIWLVLPQELRPDQELKEHIQALQSDPDTILEKVFKELVGMNVPKRQDFGLERTYTNVMNRYLQIKEVEAVLRDRNKSKKEKYKIYKESAALKNYISYRLAVQLESFLKEEDKREWISSKVLKSFWEEMEENKKRLVSLFRAPPEVVKELFVEFPITLEVTNQGFYKMVHPSICNRLFLSDGQGKDHILFPDPEQEEIRRMVEEEIPLGRINNSGVTYSFVDTKRFHKSSDAVGGNLHCLIKTR